jgi:two-component system sensor histidine kinase CiaH
LLIIIIDNAFKYTEEKDSIYLSVHDAGSTVNINLYDTGIGISSETKKHIFDRFYREEKARSRAKGGTGLGMPIAQTIVLGHKGTISVDNNKPKGTIIYISISKDNS